jgi:hypothetical protein
VKGENVDGNEIVVVGGGGYVGVGGGSESVGGGSESVEGSPLLVVVVGE